MCVADLLEGQDLLLLLERPVDDVVPHHRARFEVVRHVLFVDLSIPRVVP